MTTGHDLNDPRALAYQLRTHAAEVGFGPAGDELMRMADRIDGGTSPLAHHGCPDPTVPTARCLECRMVLEAEVDGGRLPSVFVDVEVGAECPTCRGNGDLGGEVNGAPLGCDPTSPLPVGTPICDGTGRWAGSRIPYRRDR